MLRTAHIGVAALWIGVLVFDSLVFGLTLSKTMALRRDCPSGLWTLIMRDGKRSIDVLWHTQLPDTSLGVLYFG